MNLRLMIMSSLAIILFTFCYKFEEHSNQESLILVFQSISASNSIVYYIACSCAIIIVADFLKQQFDGFCERKKFYAQRISLQEYEYQKNTFTKIKVNELLASQAFQEYQQRNGINGFN